MALNNTHLHSLLIPNRVTESLAPVHTGVSAKTWSPGAQSDALFLHCAASVDRMPPLHYTEHWHIHPPFTCPRPLPQPCKVDGADTMFPVFHMKN